MIKDESVLQTESFWYDLNSIEKYSNAIISYFKKDVLLDIRLGESNEVPRVNVTKMNNVDKYHMVIPKLPSFLNDAQLKKQIELRKMFLKHELSHICFTPMVELNHFHNGNFDSIRNLTYSQKRDIQFIYNALEDVRIEKIMGTSLEGTNDGFFAAVKDIAVKNDWVYKIVNEDISTLLFGIYVILRSKNVFTDSVVGKISNFRNIEAYEKVYQKYSDFHTVLSVPNMEKIMSYLAEISRDLEKIKQHFISQNAKTVEEKSQDDVDVPPKPQQDEEPNIDMNNLEKQNDKQLKQLFPLDEQKNEDKSPSDQNADSALNQEDSEDADSDGESDANDNDQVNSDDQSDGEFDEDYDSSQADEFENDINQEIEDKKLEDDILRNTQNKNGNNKTSNSSLESSLADEFQNSINEIDKENANELLDDAKELEKETDNDKVNSSVFEIDSYGNLKESAYDIFNKMVSSTFTDEKMADNYSKMFSAIEIPLKDIWRMSISQQKLKKASAAYSMFVRKHTKEISLVSAYFKNKFKDKKKITLLNNKEDGLLDDQNLYKALSKKDLDTKIFLQVGKKIGTHANFIFLLDFSGSMSGQKLSVLIKTMIILNEVLNKIGIRFMIYAFSSATSSFTLPNENMHRLIKSPHLVRNGSTYSLKENLSTETCSIVYLIKKLEEKQGVPLRAFLGHIMASRGDFGSLRTLSRMGFPIGCSTREYQAFIYLTKKYDHMKNKNMIIINDGHYDTFSNETEYKGARYEERELISAAINKIYDQMVFDFLYERPVKLDIVYYDTFAKMINNVLNNRITKDDIVQNDKKQLVLDYLVELKDLFNNSLEFFAKKDFIKNKFFDIKIKKSGDAVYLKLESKKDFMDNFEIKEESIPYNSHYLNLNISFKKSDKKVIYNVILDSFKSYNKTKLFSINKGMEVKLISVGSYFGTTNSFCDQLYKNKVDQLRKRNWGIYGIGIQDDNQKNYLGAKFATVIHKTEQLTKEVSKILY